LSQLLVLRAFGAETKIINYGKLIQRLTAQLQLLSRLALLGSFVGVRYTRFAHSAHPHCARRRTFAYAQVRSYRRAQRQQLETLGASHFVACFESVWAPSMAPKSKLGGRAPRANPFRYLPAILQVKSIN